MPRIYATVRDELVFVPMKDGYESHEGVKGSWQTKEGPIVAKYIEVDGPESFKAAYDKIVAEFPGAIVRWMKDPKPAKA